jgi:predicted metal-dependent hydrolase
MNPKVEIIRSARRKKTVGAKYVDGVIVVRAPARMSDAELQPMVEKLTARLMKQVRKTRLDDTLLQRRAQALNRRHFKGDLSWKSIVWSWNQEKRLGSCSRHNGTIRISYRVAEMPAFVRDYVIVHELAHLVEPNHGPDFWRLVNRYPRTERARGFVMGAGYAKVEG